MTHELMPMGSRLPSQPWDRHNYAVVTVPTKDIEDALLSVRHDSFGEGYTQGNKEGYQRGFKDGVAVQAPSSPPAVLLRAELGDELLPLAEELPTEPQLFIKDVHENAKTISHHAHELSAQARISRGKGSYKAHKHAHMAHKMAARHSRETSEFSHSIGDKKSALHHGEKAHVHEAHAEFHKKERRRLAKDRHTESRAKKGLIHFMFKKGILEEQDGTIVVKAKDALGHGSDKKGEHTEQQQDFKDAKRDQVKEIPLGDSGHSLKLAAYDPEDDELQYQYTDKDGKHVGDIRVRPRKDGGVSIIDHGLFESGRGKGLGRQGILALAKTYGKINSLALGGASKGPSEAAQKAWQSLEGEGAYKNFFDPDEPKKYNWTLDLRKPQVKSFSQEANALVVKALAKRMKRRDWISAKTAVIMKDGYKGNHVSQAQACATAKRMWNKKSNRRKPMEAKALPEWVWLMTGGIAVNAEELQYKNTDGAADGLNDQRRQEDMDKPFDPLTVPPIAVWKAEDGQVYVVDGHKRLDQAKRKGVPNIRGFFIEATSFKDAKEKGEKLNVKLGTKALLPEEEGS